MKKLLHLTAIVALAGAINSAAFAEEDHDHDHGEERVQHYQGKEFKTAQEALESLKSDNEKIAAILESETLAGSQLEKIHQISYGLEDGIDKLIAEKAGDAEKLATIDESIQAVHYASENHEEAKVREWFTKLQTATGSLHEDGAESTAQVEDGVYELRIKDHTFTPDELHVPAGEKIKLIVHNDDPTSEEFESDDFRREKIIAGNSKATIYVGPLEPGKYHFFGEFNLDKANGYLYAE